MRWCNLPSGSGQGAYITFFFFFFFILFILLFFGCVGSSLLHAGFSLVAASGGYSSLQCTGFSLQWLLLLQNTGSRSTGFSSCGSQALERRLSSCGAWAQLLRSMWDLPAPGLEAVSPALAGGFLTTAPPGKPRPWTFNTVHLIKSHQLSAQLNPVSPSTSI